MTNDTVEDDDPTESEVDRYECCGCDLIAEEVMGECRPENWIVNWDIVLCASCHAAFESWLDERRAALGLKRYGGDE